MSLVRRSLNARLLQTFKVAGDGDTECFRFVDTALPEDHIARQALNKQRQQARSAAAELAADRRSLQYWRDTGMLINDAPGTWIGQEESMALAVYLLCSIAEFKASFTIFSQVGATECPHYFLVVGTAQHEIFRFPDKLGRKTFMVDPWVNSISIQRNLHWDTARILDGLSQRPDAVVDPPNCAQLDLGTTIEPISFRPGVRFH